MSKMNLRKFEKKLKIENIIKSIICGFSASLLIDALIIILFKRIPIDIVIWVHVLITIAMSAGLSFWFYKFVFKMNYKVLAKRLDKDANLQERVRTMVEFQDDDSSMVCMQRQDTNKKLDSVETKTLKMRFSFSNFILAIIAAAALTTSIFVETRYVEPKAEQPSSSDSENSDQSSSTEDSTDSSNSSDQQDSSDGQSDEQGGSDEQTDIGGIIDQMEEEVRNNEATGDENEEGSLANDLIGSLEDLKENLTGEDSDQKDPGEEIDKTKDEIDKAIDDAITKDEIGEALQKQDTTKDIGDGIVDGDNEKTNEAFDNMRDSLKDLTGDELKDALKDIVDDVNNALDESGVEDGDSLKDSLKDFADSLEDLLGDTNSSDVQDKLDEIFDEVKDRVNGALDDQNSLEDLKDSLDQQLEDLKDALQNQGQGNGDGEDGDGEENPSDGNGEDDPSDGDGEDGNSGGGENASGSEGGTQYASDDLIYDPRTGKYVTYGELINEYYEEILNGMEDGDIPEDIIKMIEDYINSLYYQGSK